MLCIFSSMVTISNVTLVRKSRILFFTLWDYQCLNEGIPWAFYLCANFQCYNLPRKRSQQFLDHVNFIHFLDRAGFLLQQSPHVHGYWQSSCKTEKWHPIMVIYAVASDCSGPGYYWAIWLVFCQWPADMWLLSLVGCNCKEFSYCFKITSKLNVKSNFWQRLVL